MSSSTPIALLVDSDVGTREAHKQGLEAQGYNVVVAGSEAEALAAVTRSAPNVMFLHLGAGGSGNASLIQALRSNDASRHIPVVVLSNRPKVKVGNKELKAVQRDLW